MENNSELGITGRLRQIGSKLKEYVLNPRSTVASEINRKAQEKKAAAEHRKIEDWESVVDHKTGEDR